MATNQRPLVFVADRECELARCLGKPVYGDVSELPRLDG
jgi:hypothetical protein